MQTPDLRLSLQELSQYRADGVVRLPGAVPRAEVDAMAAVVWRRLRVRHGVHQDRPQTWHTPHPAQLAAKTDELAAMASPRVVAVIDQLLGVDGWVAPERWGLPLVTLPGFTEAWDVPHKAWHLDLQASAEPPRVARVFILLADLEPGGGATGFVAGSHRLVRDAARDAGCTLRSAEARARLVAKHPWFADLFTRRAGEDRRARFMESGAEIDDGRVWVGEMIGQAGDAWFMDPHMLHATTPNAGTAPRLMLTEWIYGRGESAAPD